MIHIITKLSGLNLEIKKNTANFNSKFAVIFGIKKNPALIGGNLEIKKISVYFRPNFSRFVFHQKLIFIFGFIIISGLGFMGRGTRDKVKEIFNKNLYLNLFKSFNYKIMVSII